MERDELKFLWGRMSADRMPADEMDVSKIIREKHSRRVTARLGRQKRKLAVYVAAFLVYLGLAVYVFIYLQLELSVASIVPLGIAGLFLWIRVLAETGNFFILAGTADDLSVKESLLAFRRRLKWVRRLEFTVRLLFFYGIAAGLLVMCAQGRTGLDEGMQPFLYALVVLLLVMPWIKSYPYRRDYEKLYSGLRDATRSFDEE